MSTNAANQVSSNPLLQRFFDSPAERQNIENGKRIVSDFYQQQVSNQTSLNFFLGRKQKWQELLLWAKGSQDMKQFLNMIDVLDANKAYVNLDTTPQRIAAKFVGTLVESMAKNKTYPQVKAIDDGSMNEKQQRLFDALYRMYDKDLINQLSEEAGVQFEPPNAYVPDDEISAKVYFELEDRLPKEMRFEQMLLNTQNNIKFERVLNRKGIFDLVTLNFEATKIERLAPKSYTVRKCVPTNMVYNFFMNDTGEQEISMIGEFYNLKVKDFREKFGKSESNPSGLTEEQIFELARSSTNKNIGTFSFNWIPQWEYSASNVSRPYDDYSIMVFDCEIDCGEDAYYVQKKDNFGRDIIESKKGVPYQVKQKDGVVVKQEKPDNVEVIKKKRNSWMRGVYAPYGDVMLYWGRPDVIVCPYTSVNKTLSSYTVNIPNNDGDYVPSLFERILEPLKEYSLTKLKRKQLITQVRPSGIRIDIESARNLDLGNGDSIAWEETLRIFNQTGTEVWSSKGIDPLQPQAPPLSNTVQDTSVQKIAELTNILNAIVAEIRDLIGVPVYRDGSDVGDRTAAKLAEGQNASSYNVTDFILNAHNQVWEETYYKLCLLHWNDIVKEEPESANDMLNTRFDVSIQMKSTEYQKQLMEADIQRWSQVVDAQGNPMLSPKDAMILRDIENPKLQRWFLVSTLEKNKRDSEERSARLQAQNAQVQQESMVAAKQEEFKALEAKMIIDVKKAQSESKEKKEQIFLTQIGDMRKSGIVPPPEWVRVETQILQGLLMDASVENRETEMAIEQGIQEAEQEQMAAMQEQQMQGQMQPQEQMM